MIVGWIWSCGTPIPDIQGLENVSYAGVATAEDDDVVIEFDGELADGLDDDEGDGAEQTGIDPGEIRCVLPPIRSSSVEAGAARSTGSDLLDAS